MNEDVTMRSRNGMARKDFDANVESMERLTDGTEMSNDITYIIHT